jgi:hypothetical protein
MPTIDWTDDFRVMECRGCGFTGDDVQEFVSTTEPGERICPRCSSRECYMVQGMIFIRFSSHRARAYGLRALDRTPQAYYPAFTSSRKPGAGGIYLVTEAEIAAMRAYSDHARFTRVRGPYDDLRECLTWS